MRGGVYCRDYQWSDSRVWTLMVSLWYPFILFSVVPVVCVLRHAMLRRVSSNA